MKTGYSRGRLIEQEHKNQMKQEQLIQQQKDSRARQRQLISEKNELRQRNKIIQAKKRLEEVQKQEQERYRRQNHRNKYINYLRSQNTKAKLAADSFISYSSRNNSRCSDNRDCESTRIPKPSLSRNSSGFDNRNSKIPKPGQQQLLWKKGELLDSLDLGSTGIKQFLQLQKEEEILEEIQNDVLEDSLDDQNWLRSSIDKGIKEWTSVRKKKQLVKQGQQVIQEVPKNKMQVIQGKVNVRVREDADFRRQRKIPSSNQISVLKKDSSNSKLSDKHSKFVDKIRQIPNQKDLFLDSELYCIEAEEAKLQASIAKLKIPKHFQDIPITDDNTLNLQNSIDRLTDLLEKRTEAYTDCESICSRRNNSLDKQQINTDTKSVQSRISCVTEMPRNLNKPPRQPKSVQRIGAVYNPIAARSGRYNETNPIPQYKIRPQKRSLSQRSRPKYTEIVTVNPNVDLKDIFSEEELKGWKGN